MDRREKLLGGSEEERTYGVPKVSARPVATEVLKMQLRAQVAAWFWMKIGGRFAGFDLGSAGQESALAEAIDIALQEKQSETIDFQVSIQEHPLLPLILRNFAYCLIERLAVSLRTHKILPALQYFILASECRALASDGNTASIVLPGYWRDIEERMQSDGSDAKSRSLYRKVKLELFPDESSTSRARHSPAVTRFPHKYLDFIKRVLGDFTLLAKCPAGKLTYYARVAVVECDWEALVLFEREIIKRANTPSQRLKAIHLLATGLKELGRMEEIPEEMRGLLKSGDEGVRDPELRQFQECAVLIAEAISNRKRGDWAKVEEVERKIIHRKPGYVRAHLALAVALKEQGKREELRKVCQEIAALRGGMKGLEEFGLTNMLQEPQIKVPAEVPDVKPGAFAKPAPSSAHTLLSPPKGEAVEPPVSARAEPPREGAKAKVQSREAPRSSNINFATFSEFLDSMKRALSTWEADAIHGQNLWRSIPSVDRAVLLEYLDYLSNNLQARANRKDPGWGAFIKKLSHLRQHAGEGVINIDVLADLGARFESLTPAVQRNIATIPPFSQRLS